MLGSAAEFIFGGGVLGKFAKASNAAQVAANIAVLQAQGQDVTDLTTKFNNYVSSNNLGGLKNFITGKNLAKQINKTQVDVGLFRESKDVFGNDIFKSDDDFNKQLQDNAPAGMVYTPEQGAYIRPEGVSAAPSTSTRPEGGFAAAKAAATPVTAVPKKNDEPSTNVNDTLRAADDRPTTWSGGQVATNQDRPSNRDAGPSGAERVQAAVAAGQKEAPKVSYSGTTRYSGSGRATGGLVSRPKKKK